MKKREFKKRIANKGKAESLSLKQEAFCQLYVKGDREFFGNGVKCYLEIYGLKNEEGKSITYQTAQTSSSRMLLNDFIIARINELLETEGFNNENVDKQHLFLISQFADLRTKISAIKEYNSLKNRIDNKLDLTSGGKPIGVIYLPQKNGKGLETDSKTN